MDGVGPFSERQITAVLLILCGVVFAVGGILFMGRAMLNWPIAQSPAYLVWERGFIIAALIINLLGLALLEGLLRTDGDLIFARSGLVITVVAVAILIVAEAAFLNRQEGPYAQVVLYVVLALLAQVAFGVALLRTELVAGWVGWAVIIWNLLWLVVLPIFSRQDMYYPVIHHAAPLLIGIMLLVGSGK